MKLNNRESYILKTVFISLLSILFVLALFEGIKNHHIDLLKTKKVTGVVENSGIETKTRSKGRKTNDFYIKLAGFNTKLKVGRVFGNYNDLIGTIQKGDSLTVYYEQYGNDLSVIEIQRKWDILLRKSEYENLSIITGVFGLAGIIACIRMIFEARKKYRKKLNIDN